MPIESIPTPAFVKGDYAFEVTRQYSDLETSDDWNKGLVVFARAKLGDREYWHLMYVHSVVGQSVTEEAQEVDDEEYFGSSAAIKVVYKAGPFTVQAEEHGYRSYIKEVTFTADERGRPVTASMQQREARITAEQDAEDERSFNEEFRIDEDGHWHLRH